jgi:hypothetical protein
MRYFSLTKYFRIECGGRPSKPGYGIWVRLGNKVLTVIDYDYCGVSSLSKSWRMNIINFCKISIKWEIPPKGGYWKPYIAFKWRSDKYRFISF